MERERAIYLNAQLIAAIRREDIDGVRKWLDKGASPHGRRQSVFAHFFWGREFSPLWEAMYVGSVAIVEILLEAGADPKEKDVMSGACSGGSRKIVELLIIFGAWPGPRDLQYAVQRNQISVVEFLLEQGVEMDRKLMNHVESYGFRKSPELLKLLEKYGLEHTDAIKEYLAGRDSRDKHMGAWGIGAFDNDSAQDWLMDFEYADDALVRVTDTFSAILDRADRGTYIDVDLGASVVVAGELLAALMGRPTKDLPENTSRKIEELHVELNDNLSELRKMGEKAVTEALKGPNSELRQLWLGSESYGEWVAQVENLLSRLRL